MAESTKLCSKFILCILSFWIFVASVKCELVSVATEQVTESYNFVGSIPHTDITAYILPVELDKSCRPINFSLDVSIYPNMTALKGFWENQCDRVPFESIFERMDPSAFIIAASKEITCLYCSRRHKKVNWVFTREEFIDSIFEEQDLQLYRLVFERSPFYYLLEGNIGLAYRWTFFILFTIYSVFCFISLKRSVKNIFRLNYVSSIMILSCIYPLSRMVYYATDPEGSRGMMPLVASKIIWWIGLLVIFYIYCLICMFWIDVSTFMIHERTKIRLKRFTYFTAVLFTIGAIVLILRFVIKFRVIGYLFFFLLLPVVFSQTIVFAVSGYKVIVGFKSFNFSEEKKVILGKFTMVLIGLCLSMILYIVLFVVMFYCVLFLPLGYGGFVSFFAIFEIISSVYLSIILYGFSRFRPPKSSQGASASSGGSHNLKTKEEAHLAGVSISL